MKLKKNKFFIILVTTLGFTNLYAQESINTSGGEGSGSSGTISYSLGQVVFNSNSGTNGSISQGVQQPFEISIISGIEELQRDNISLKTYPNPTQNNLTLQTKDIENNDLSALLYDFNGSLLISQKISNNEKYFKIYINCRHWCSYFLIMS